jgi:hypothetical protein
VKKIYISFLNNLIRNQLLLAGCIKSPQKRATLAFLDQDYSSYLVPFTNLNLPMLPDIGPKYHRDRYETTEKQLLKIVKSKKQKENLPNLV